MQELIGEENVQQRPVVTSMSMRELYSTLTDEQPAREFLADLSSSPKRPTT